MPVSERERIGAVVVVYCLPDWLLECSSVATVIVGARDERQLLQNLGAVGWNLTPKQVAKLDRASAVPKIYLFWHQTGFAERNPFPTE